MPWIQVVDGKSATLKSDDGWEDSEKITSLEAYKALDAECESQGLALFDTVNSDDNTLAFFLGKELYPDRHIYQGVTLTLDQDVTPEQKAATITQFDKLMVLLQEAGFNPVVAQGLVVSQFD